MSQHPIDDTSPLTERERRLIAMTIDSMREEFASMLERMAADPRAVQKMSVRESLGTAAKVARRLNAAHPISEPEGRA